LDTPSAEWSIVDIEFLELVEEQIRKARGYLEVDEGVMEESAFILISGVHKHCYEHRSA
jgi:hypothetical protein